MIAGFEKNNLFFSIPNSICLSVTALQTLRFYTVGYLHLKPEKVLESQGYAVARHMGLPEP